MRAKIPGCDECAQRFLCGDARKKGACLYGPEIRTIFTLTLGNFHIEDFSLIDIWTEEVQATLARFIRKRMG